MQLARSLGYCPNGVARGLVRKRMHTVGLVLLHGNTPAHTNPFLTTVLDGVLSVNTRRRQNTTLRTVSSWEQSEQHLLDPYDGRCDGVLLMVPPVECVLTDVLLQRKVPFVIINGHDHAGWAFGVDIDNVGAACRMGSPPPRRGPTVDFARSMIRKAQNDLRPCHF